MPSFYDPFVQFCKQTVVNLRRQIQRQEKVARENLAWQTGLTRHVQQSLVNHVNQNVEKASTAK